MTNVRLGETSDLFDFTTGAWLGVLDQRGREVLVPSAVTDASGNVTGLSVGGGLIPLQTIPTVSTPYKLRKTQAALAKVRAGVGNMTLAVGQAPNPHRTKHGTLTQRSRHA